MGYYTSNCNFLIEVNDVFEDSSCLLIDNAVKKQQMYLSELATNIQLLLRNDIFLTYANVNKLCKMELPSSDAKVLARFRNITFFA